MVLDGVFGAYGQFFQRSDIANVGYITRLHAGKVSIQNKINISGEENSPLPRKLPTHLVTIERLFSAIKPVRITFDGVRA